MRDELGEVLAALVSPGDQDDRLIAERLQRDDRRGGVRRDAVVDPLDAVGFEDRLEPVRQAADAGERVRAGGGRGSSAASSAASAAQRFSALWRPRNGSESAPIAVPAPSLTPSVLEVPAVRHAEQHARAHRPQRRPAPRVARPVGARVHARAARAGSASRGGTRPRSRASRRARGTGSSSTATCGPYARSETWKLESSSTTHSSRGTSSRSRTGRPMLPARWVGRSERPCGERGRRSSPSPSFR